MGKGEINAPNEKDYAKLMTGMRLKKAVSAHPIQFTKASQFGVFHFFGTVKNVNYKV